MGCIAHKVLIVTGYDGATGDHWENAHKKATVLFGELMSGVVRSEWNHYKTFMVAPDGSKEGWSESDYTDSKMESMLAYLKTTACRYSDGSSNIQWILAEYGETGRRILKSNCKNLY